MTKRILIGKIGAPHGIRGQVRLISFSGNPDIFEVCKDFHTSESGPETLHLKLMGCSGGAFLAQVEGVSDRTSAENLKGTDLYVSRSRFPDLKDSEYYHADLIGLRAIDVQGASVGTVIAVENFGAGDILEIRPENAPTFYLSFTNENVPEINVKEGFLVVNRPDEKE